jgi:SWI/SNF-related matrix-associated actin-dependent regulator 1 of chromatin subfamily A
MTDTTGLDTGRAAPPSAEVLAEAARRIAAAYPGLYEHQRSGVAFLCARRRAILADEMGLGKTRQAVIAAREAHPAGPYLVICPASVKLAWAAEIRAVEPDADVCVVRSGDAFEPGHRWTVLTYDLHGRCERAVAGVDWAVVILDEAHYLRNRSARTRRVLSLVGVDGHRAGAAGARAGDGDRDSVPSGVYLLTGTPMVNRPRDLFHLLQIVGHPLARSFTSYARRYCAAYDNGYGLDTRGASNLEELARLTTGVMLRRTKTETTDLPEKVRSWLPVEGATPAVARAETAALAWLQTNPDRNGPGWQRFLGLLSRARRTLAAAKAPAVVELVDDLVAGGQKVVVFTSYVEVVERFATHFADRAVAITGSNTARERHAAARRLQTDDDVRVLIGNLVAAGVGITLTAATHVVFNDLDWVPGNHWQAEDRIHRIGQRSTAFATYCYAPDTLDEYVAALLAEKAANIGVLESEVGSGAGLVQAVVDAALSGRRPAVPGPVATVRAPETRTPGTGSPEGDGDGDRPGGVLDEVLDLWASDRSAAEVYSDDRHVEVRSGSRPDVTYTVTVGGGVITCTCPGFEYRGTCKHARAAAAGEL